MAFYGLLLDLCEWLRERVQLVADVRLTYMISNFPRIGILESEKAFGSDDLRALVCHACRTIEQSLPRLQAMLTGHTGLVDGSSKNE